MKSLLVCIFACFLTVFATPSEAQFLKDLAKGLQEAAKELETSLEEVNNPEPEEATAEANQKDKQPIDCSELLGSHELNEASVLGLNIGMPTECAMRLIRSDEFHFSVLEPGDDWSRERDSAGYGLSRDITIGYAGRIGEHIWFSIGNDPKSGGANKIEGSFRRAFESLEQCQQFTDGFVNSFTDALGTPTENWMPETVNTIWHAGRYMANGLDTGRGAKWSGDAKNNPQARKWTASVSSGCKVEPAPWGIVAVELQAFDGLTPTRKAPALVDSDPQLQIYAASEADPNAGGCELTSQHPFSSIEIKGFRFGTNFECALPVCRSRAFATLGSVSNADFKGLLTTQYALDQWTEYNIFPGDAACGYERATVRGLGPAGQDFDVYSDVVRMNLNKIDGTIEEMTHFFKQPFSSVESCTQTKTRLIDFLKAEISGEPSVTRVNTRVKGERVPTETYTWEIPSWKSELTIFCDDNPVPFMELKFEVESAP